jgi:sec-independent protein translocase protein TatA
MFGLSLTELLVILAIVLLLFGTKKLRNLGGDLGGAIKGFRSAMNDDAEKKDEDEAPKTDYIEGEARRESAEGAEEAREPQAAGDRKG